MLGPIASAPLYRPPAQASHARGEANAPASGQESQAPDTEAGELTESEKAQVEELKQRDAQVKAHEMAHIAAAGGLAQGGPTYVYQVGPDGKSYAVGGSVNIDTSPGRTPAESIQKARRIRAAALAPSDPSPQDLKVASAASSMAAESSQKRDKDQGENAGRTLGESVSNRYRQSGSPDTIGFTAFA